MRCPSCRAVPFEPRASRALARLLADTTAPCVQCGARVATASRLAHGKNDCAARSGAAAVCPNAACAFAAAAAAAADGAPPMLDHLLRAHTDDVLRATAALYRARRLDALAASNRLVDADPCRPRLNAKGGLARLGSSGRFYCGAPLPTNCRCCDGFCGPDSGHNCPECHDLDVVVKRLPNAFILNADGFACRVDPRAGNNLYYCGRKISRASSDYCSCDSARQCRACQFTSNEPILRRQNILNNDGDDREDYEVDGREDDDFDDYEDYDDDDDDNDHEVEDDDDDDDDDGDVD
ncbi:hypothetical protein HK100_010090 [Physocladia obscura]|uniref:Uncharacterized protein n=1 Tax=Physocladia obscura TaxID=109957 RepID=A0AAD5XAU3_9FUNG|nr:hypothetical protein HK100_010090 [Physocladia obscura]